MIPFENAFFLGLAFFSGLGALIPWAVKQPDNLRFVLSVMAAVHLILGLTL
jgi:hypothetical protein